jgi:hypothetical protein
MKINETLIYIVIFCVLLFLLYIIPKMMIFLFHSIMGFILIFTIIYLFSRKKNSFDFNHSLAFGLLMIFIIFYLSISKSVSSNNSLGVNSLGVNSLNVASLNVASLKEGYVSSTWSEKLIQQFLTYQYYHNPNYIFDINIIQKQASSKEVEDYLKNGKWNWSPQVENIYKKYIYNAPFVSFDEKSSIENAKKIYNEKAITDLMSWNSKEGYFILNGAVLGQSKNLPKNINNQIKCNTKGQMMKIINKDVDIYPGYMIQEKTILPFEDIPKTLTGFQFIDGPCNPCIQEKNNTCKFKLNIGDGGEISSIWKYLWGLNNTEYTKKENRENVGVQPPKVDPLYEENLQVNQNF